MSHLYAKLDTHTRTEAVERARSLGLLAPPGTPTLTQACPAPPALLLNVAPSQGRPPFALWSVYSRNWEPETRCRTSAVMSQREQRVGPLHSAPGTEASQSWSRSR
jgi:hypothetical protein